LKGRHFDAELAQIFIRRGTGDGADRVALEIVERLDRLGVALLRHDRRSIPPGGSREGDDLQPIGGLVNIGGDDIDALRQHQGNELPERRNFVFDVLDPDPLERGLVNFDVEAFGLLGIGIERGVGRARAYTQSDSVGHRPIE
jgi:hypothetical protein